jgi:hypothetical protein
MAPVGFRGTAVALGKEKPRPGGRGQSLTATCVAAKAYADPDVASMSASRAGHVSCGGGVEPTQCRHRAPEI